MGRLLFYLLYRFCWEILSWWPSKNEAHCLLKSLSSDQQEKPQQIFEHGVSPLPAFLPVVGGGGRGAADFCWCSPRPKLLNESVLTWICSSASTELLREAPYPALKQMERRFCVANENILWQKCCTWLWRPLTKPAGYRKDGKSTTAQVWLLVSQLSSC